MTCANLPHLIAQTLFEVGLATIALAVIGMLIRNVVHHHD